VPKKNNAGKTSIARQDLPCETMIENIATNPVGVDNSRVIRAFGQEAHVLVSSEQTDGAFCVLRISASLEFKHGIQTDRPLIAPRVLLEWLELGRQCLVVANLRAD